MALTIDNLEIQIEANAQQATSGIDRLAKSLGKLRTAVGDSSGLASNLTHISNALKAFSGVGKINLTPKINQLSKLQGLIPVLGGAGGAQLANNLREISSGIATFSTIPKMNVNVGSISKAITSLNTATSTFDPARLSQFSTQMQGIASGLSILSTAGKGNFSSLINSLKKIPEITASLDTSTLDAFAEKIQSLTAIMTPLSVRMDMVARGFNALPRAMMRAINATNKQTQANNKLNRSYGGLFTNLSRTAARFWTLYYTVSRVASVFADLFNESNEYTETLNLFKVSLGDAADSALKYAEAVSDAMGIDVAEWMQNQGIFKNLVTGFGVANDAAVLMSQNLAQLSYDMASFFNASTVEEAFDKLSSAMSGQVKGLREYGIDTTIASLQQYALSKGIDASVRSMTQAQKAMLRYSYIMEQSAKLGILNDMAKTIQSPANAMRVLSAQIKQLKRALGDIVSVLVTRFIPWIMAAVELVTEFAETLAKAFGFEVMEFPDIDVNLGAEVEDEAEQAEDAIKGLKKQLMGFDELNILKSDKDESKTLGGDLGIDLPSYDFLKGFEGLDLEPYKEKLEDIFRLAGLIGAALLAWKIAPSLMSGLNSLASILGATLLIDSVIAVLDEGLSFKTIIEAAIGGALLGAGLGFKYGSWPGALGGVVIGIGIALSIVGITSMFAEGVDIKNTITSAVGMALAGSGIGFVLGGWGTALGGAVIGIGVTLMIAGIKSAIDEGVNAGNVVEIITGALMTAGGIITAIKLFNSKYKAPTPDLEDAGRTIQETSTGTSTLTPKLKSLATNLLWGVAIIGEVAAAAIIIVGAIAVLGWELEQVGKAWQPVIDNAGTVAIALGIGTTLLAAIGTATYYLGTGGGQLAANMGIGTGVLAEVGVAAGLFITEIWAIGFGLEKIGEAWQPVLDNGENIAIAIGIGTGILVAVGAATALLGVAATSTGGTLPLAIGLGTAMLLELGVATGLFIAEILVVGEGLRKVGEAWQPVLNDGETIKAGIIKGTELLTAIGIATAALGAITIGTAGTLPLAIGVGTAVLLELGAACVLLTESLVSVADELSDSLSPSLDSLNEKLPGLKDDMSDFTDYLKGFATEITDYTSSMGTITWASIVNGFLSLFSGNPFGSFSKSVSTTKDDTSDLIEKLNSANPELEKAIELLTNYTSLMSELKLITDENGSIELATGMFTNLKEAGKQLVTGLGAGIEDKRSELLKDVKKLGKDMAENIKSGLEEQKSNVQKAFEGLFSGIQIKLPHFSMTGSFNLEKMTVPSIKVDWYAQGGFPSMGEMFIAREAGPELVGRIGNKTAVANNDQITQGIASAVYSAMMAAQADGNGSGGTNARIIVQIGERAVGEAAVKFINGQVVQTGKSPIYAF